jgi:hypothetical protein
MFLTSLGKNYFLNNLLNVTTEDTLLPKHFCGGWIEKFYMYHRAIK